MHDTMGSTEEKPSKTLEFQQIIEPQNGALVVFTETFESATKFLQWVQIFATGNKRRKKAKAMESSEFCLNFPGEPSYSNTFEQVSPYLMRKVTWRPYIGWISSRFVSFETKIRKYAFLALKNHTETHPRPAIFHGTLLSEGKCLCILFTLFIVWPSGATSFY